jgi:glycosyltransferase involved in cell wall biosynthesis
VNERRSEPSPRVLSRPAFENRRDNPYNYLLCQKLRERGAEVEEYSFQRSFLSSFDIFHIHWPEVTFNTATSTVQARLQARLLLAAIDVAKRRGAKLVWTVHNLRSHEQKYPEAERRFWRHFVPRVDAVIALSGSGLEAVRERFPELARRPGFVIPHHHYRGEYEDVFSREQARARLGLSRDAAVMVFFGRVVEYKNLPALVEATRALPPTLDGRELRLLIAGKPRTEKLERELRAASAGDPRIVLDLVRVPREQAQVHFRAADLIVLPYREILNSGSAVLALSFDRPVLMPALGAAKDLKALLGADWIFEYRELSPAVLDQTLRRVLGRPDHPPGSHLTALDPETIADQTLSAYRAIIGA